MLGAPGAWPVPGATCWLPQVAWAVPEADVLGAGGCLPCCCLLPESKCDVTDRHGSAGQAHMMDVSCSTGFAPGPDPQLPWLLRLVFTSRCSSAFCESEGIRVPS